MSDLYQAPEAELVVSDASRVGGSPEQAVVGDYEFSVREIFAEARAGLSGSMGKIWSNYLVIFIISALMSFLGTLPTVLLGEDALLALSLSFIVQIVVAIGQMALSIAGLMVCLRALQKVASPVDRLLDPFNRMLPLFVAYLLMVIVIILGFALLILPGIYLAIAYMFGLYLVVEKNMGAWQALETSRKAVSKHWFKFLGFFIILLFINLFGLLLLGIGLIWTIPFTSLAFAALYRNMFGIEAETL